MTKAQKSEPIEHIIDATMSLSSRTKLKNQSETHKGGKIQVRSKCSAPKGLQKNQKSEIAPDGLPLHTSKFVKLKSNHDNLLCSHFVHQIEGVLVPLVLLHSIEEMCGCSIGIKDEVFECGKHGDDLLIGKAASTLDQLTDGWRHMVAQECRP